MATRQQLEVLSTALDAALRAEQRVRMGDLTSDAIRQDIRTTNVLVDACISCGMASDEPSHVEWASVRVAQDLCAA